MTEPHDKIYGPSVPLFPEGVIKNRRGSASSPSAADPKHQHRRPSLAEIGSGAWRCLAEKLANRHQIPFSEAWNTVRRDCPEVVALAHLVGPAILTNRNNVALTLEDMSQAMTYAEDIEQRMREQLRADFGAGGVEYARTPDQLHGAGWKYLQQSLKAEPDFDKAWEKMKKEQPLLWQALVLHHDAWMAEKAAIVERARAGKT